MSQLAQRVHTHRDEIARLETLVTQLPSEARVELTLEDGGQLRGTVAVQPTVQTFRDMDGQEGTNGLLRLDDLDDPAHQHVVWLDTVAKVETLGSF